MNMMINKTYHECNGRYWFTFINGWGNEQIVLCTQAEYEANRGGEMSNIVTIISRYTSASRGAKSHADDGHGRPLCNDQPRGRYNGWSQDEGEVTCPRCLCKMELAKVDGLADTIRAGLAAQFGPAVQEQERVAQGKRLVAVGDGFGVTAYDAVAFNMIDDMPGAMGRLP